MKMNVTKQQKGSRNCEVLFKWESSVLAPPEACWPNLEPSLLREKDRPTWLAGSSSSLLSEDASAFFSWDAGPRILILTVLELPSF